MPIVEEGTNYPPELGYTNWPRTDVRSGFIGPQAMALARGETPVHLAQRIRAQMANYPIIPVIDRPHPLLDMVKQRPTVIPRLKLIGAFGIVDPAQTEYNIPRPYPRPMGWPAGKAISTIPSVIADISGASGPERTTHPQMVRSSIHVIV